MLSTQNQRKLSTATASARSITRKTTKSGFPMSMIPNFNTVFAISIASCFSLALTGCGGGNDPTTRTDTSTSTNSTSTANSYNLTVQSPVLLHNVQVTVMDTTSGTVIGQTTMSNGNNSVINNIPPAYLNGNDIMMVTLSPIDSTSQYFDPMLNHELGAMTLFNQPLHAFISMGSQNTTIKVDPFSEIAYQRTLVRSGTVDFTHPLINQVTPTQLNNANSELTQAMGTVATTPYTALFNSPASIASLNMYTPASSTTPAQINVPGSYAAIALGQLALYADNNLSDTTPYLNFAARAALDMRDGHLDGMTIAGGDVTNQVQISNPILYSGVVSQTNDDPNNTSMTLLSNVNANQRNQRGTALQQATIQYFNTINASLPVASRTDSASLNYIQSFNYATFIPSGAPTNAQGVGAGNYTLAFGLPTGVNFKNALDANDASGRSNDIMQLNGVYKSSNGCQLTVGYDGIITLSQGSQSYQATVNRKYSDSLTRNATNPNLYLLNVTSADQTAPRFIQMNILQTSSGINMISADTGRSSQPFPTTLDTVDLNCSF